MTRAKTSFFPFKFEFFCDATEISVSFYRQLTSALWNWRQNSIASLASRNDGPTKTFWLPTKMNKKKNKKKENKKEEELEDKNF